MRHPALRTWDDLDLRALGAGRLDRTLQVEATTPNERSDQYRWTLRVDGAPATRAGPWLTEPFPALLDEVQQRVFELAEEVAASPTRTQRLRHAGRLRASTPTSPSARCSRSTRSWSLALTGTPIENAWRDLWTLCDFALPGRLGTLREFHDRYPPSGDVKGWASSSRSGSSRS